MIRKIAAVLVILICFFAAPAFSHDEDYRTYLTLGGGLTFMQETEQDHSDTVSFPNNPITISSDSGFNGFIATGLDYDNGRVEFSLGYNQADFEEFEDSTGATTDLEGNLKVASFLVSVFWDFNKDGSVSPYFGGGVGVCHIKLDDTIIGENRDGALAYQLGLGLSFNMSENTKFDVGYKMLSVVEPNLGPIDPDYVVLHNGNAALRFLF